MTKRKIIFENGKIFKGEGFGAPADVVHEVVFNTSIVGYQEIFSDASYFGQIVCMTYPLIGNYGVNDNDYETKRPCVGGVIVSEYNDKPSNHRCARTLGADLAKYNIAGISGVDTRQITRMIRDGGTLRALITDDSTALEKGLEVIRKTPVVRNHISNVSSKKCWNFGDVGAAYNTVVIDCGVKNNIIKSLAARNCAVTVVPYNTDAENILKLRPDGVVISNGPGDPKDNPDIISTIKLLQGKIPIFGICMGHQLISLANGAETFKMKFGHRGSNHPVREILTDKIFITSQNHSYTVDPDSLKNTNLEITHINVLDGTVEGLEVSSEKIFSVQYHPESTPGPQDNFYLFDKFTAMIKSAKEKC
jgi:carbamoyl-phosphate synthase small subunit